MLIPPCFFNSTSDHLLEQLGSILHTNLLACWRIFEADIPSSNFDIEQYRIQVQSCSFSPSLTEWTFVKLVWDRYYSRDVVGKK